MKIKEVSNVAGEYLFYCPGCQSHHAVWTDKNKKPCWGFNNNVDKPTFTPSILVQYPTFRKFDPSGLIGVPGTEYMARCHSFITDGKIQFLGDCTHNLKNTTVELPEMDFDE